MTKRKSLFTIILCCMMFTVMFLLSACGEEEHKHTFSKDWTVNAEYHWHEAECDDTDEVKDKELHHDGEFRHNATQHWTVCPVCNNQLTPNADHNYVDFVCECGAVSDQAVVKVTSTAGVKYFDELTSSMFAELKENSLVELLKDYAINAYIALNKSVVVDLGGHTVSSAATGMFDVKEEKTAGEVNVVIKNGTIDAYKWGAYIENGGHLTIANDVTIYANRANRTDTAGITIIGTDSQLDFAGKIYVTGDTNCVSGNGNAADGGVVVNILDGAVISGAENGIYLPNSRELNIGKATITSRTALYLRSGSTTINGATLVGNGEPKEYTYKSGSCYATGDAIIIDSVGYPGGNPSLTIVTATITSVNGKEIVAYKVNGNELTVNNSTAYQVHYNSVEF